MVEACAAFGFRNRHGGQAKLGGFAKCFAREVAGLVEFAGERLYFVLGEFAHRALQQLLLFGECEIQRCSGIM